jgi:hypothetical protein
MSIAVYVMPDSFRVITWGPHLERHYHLSFMSRNPEPPLLSLPHTAGHLTPIIPPTPPTCQRRGVMP